MLAELKFLISPDVPDLRNWIPPDEEFAILVQIIAGTAGSPGEESFDVTVCTPAWVKRRVDSEGVVTGRHLLIVAEYAYDKIYDYIFNYLSACTGDTWQEIATKIARLGSWEFEDYRQ
jgi:hypothetical protein